jgi:GT2 family glycosyltransferase
MDRSTPPTISVIIPAFRCRDSIADVLCSLQTQTLPPAEIIVVDDCSPDRLEEPLAPFRHSIIYLRNPCNMGLSRTYNRGLRAAKGTYVLTLHSDCVLSPDYIALVWETLSTHSDVAAVTGQYIFHEFQKMTITDQLFTTLNLLPTQTLCSSSTEEIAFIEGKADLFRTSEIKALGLFDERLSLTAEDQDLSARYRLIGYRFLQNNNALFSSKYNGTQDSLWKVLRKQFSYAQGQMYVLMKYGTYAFRTTTRNRNLRAWHRLSQVVTTLLTLGLSAAACLWPAATLGLLTLIAVRAAYYLWIAAPMSVPTRILAIPTGLLADPLYTMGLLRGLILFWLRGQA